MPRALEANGRSVVGWACGSQVDVRQPLLETMQSSTEFNGEGTRDISGPQPTQSGWLSAKDVACHVCGKKGHSTEDFWYNPGSKGSGKKRFSKSRGKGKDMLKGRGKAKNSQNACFYRGRPGRISKGYRLIRDNPGDGGQG